MTAITVTATETADQLNGITLRLIVLTNAATRVNQNGTADGTGLDVANYHTHDTDTPSTANSRVFVAASQYPDNSPAQGVTADTYQYDAVIDTTNTQNRYTGRASALTPSPPVQKDFGWSDWASLSTAECCEFEIKASGGSLTEDATSPAVANNNGGQAATTASFDPPAGSLLVALVVMNGAGGAQPAIAMSDSSGGGGLTWDKKAEAYDDLEYGYVCVYIADIPGGGGLSITTSDPMADATTGEAYSEGLAASGGTSPYRYVIDSGSLPDGLVLS